MGSNERADHLEGTVNPPSSLSSSPAKADCLTRLLAGEMYSRNLEGVDAMRWSPGGCERGGEEPERFE